jgi:hypothetical protein
MSNRGARPRSGAIDSRPADRAVIHPPQTDAGDSDSVSATELSKLCAQACRKVGVDVLLTVHTSGRPLPSALVPEVDVAPLDLLDQQHHRAPSRSYFLARVGNKPVAPAAEQVEFLLVETLHDLRCPNSSLGRFDNTHRVKEPILLTPDCDAQRGPARVSS